MSELCMKTRADTNNRFSYSNANELIVKPLSGPPSQPPFIVRTSNITSTLENILVTNFFCCSAVIAQLCTACGLKGTCAKRN